MAGIRTSSKKLIKTPRWRGLTFATEATGLTFSRLAAGPLPGFAPGALVAGVGDFEGTGAIVTDLSDD